MHYAIVFISAFFVTSQVAIAQGSIIAPSPPSRATLDLYDTPGAGQPVKQLPAAEAGFPLPTSGAQSGFLKVKVGGQEFWVKSAQVRVAREVVASCSEAVSKQERVGATPGAVGDACK